MGKGLVTESRIFRRNPMFKRSEIFQWDEFPVPVSIEMYRPGSHRGADGNLRLHREPQDRSSWALVGDGNRKRFEMGAGWDCALEISLADGHQRWTRQRAVGDSLLRTWTTITTPGMDRSLNCTGSYQVSTDRVHGGSTRTGWLDIRRLKHGLSISLEDRGVGIRREWRLDQLSERRAGVYDLQNPDASAPRINASSDNPLSLHRTIRWLILELTGLVVAEEFLSWNAPSGIRLKHVVRGSDVKTMVMAGRSLV